MNKPLIGITTMETMLPTNPIGKRRLSILNTKFIRIVEGLGGTPIMLPTISDLTSVGNIVDMLDGVLFSSGEDVHPNSYNEALNIRYSEGCSGMGVPFFRPSVIVPDIKRDLYEISLYTHAREKQIPILGICRGMQIINIAEGGTLYQEIPESDTKHELGEGGWINYHNVIIDSNSLVSKLMGVDEYIMPSIHHQCVKDLSPNFIASGVSPDGVIEIIEAKSGDFIVGIQGHPEQSLDNFPLVNNIFEEFIRNASIRSNR
jgi:putative glutamine amidotransferase